MQVQSLGWEDSLENSMATHSSILALRIPWTESLMDYSPLSNEELDMTETTPEHCPIRLVPLGFEPGAKPSLGPSHILPVGAGTGPTNLSS